MHQDKLLAPDDEGFDMHCVSHYVENLLRRQLKNDAKSVPLGLTSVLQRSRATVLALEKLVA